MLPGSRAVLEQDLEQNSPSRPQQAVARQQKSGLATAKNLVCDCGFTHGAKRIRTADPLHAMQLVSTSEPPCNDSKMPSSTGLPQELPLEPL